MTEEKDGTCDYEVFTRGRFTVVEIHEDGILGIGISRRSQGDEMNQDLGISIALGRARKAVKLKSQNKKLQNHYMG